MANGSFTVLDPPSGISSEHLAIVSEHEWENLNITTTLSPLKHGYNCSDLVCDSNAAAGIIIRYLPNSTSFGLLLNPGGAGTTNIAFGTINDRFEWSKITQSGARINYDVANEITINAIGETYSVLINGKKIISITMPGTSKGQVGVWFKTVKWNNSSLDSYAPRFEDFLIQAVP